MAIFRLGEHSPKLDPTAWVAESAQVIGQAELAAHSSVWFNVTIRADNARIVLGAHSNVQESSVLHTDPGLELVIGDWVTIGHQAMLHGCTIGDNTLIGIQAIVLNGARIGRNCLIGAGAIVTEGKEIPDNSLVLGAPGKVVRTLSEADAANLRGSAERYAARAELFRTQLQRI